METEDVSMSWPERVLGYAATRFPMLTWLPLAFFIALAAEPKDAWMPGQATVGLATLALTVLFQFRLWDDLEDVSADRVTHPDRVLSGAPSMTPFHALLGVGLASSLILTLLIGGGVAAAVLLLVDGALVFWYRWVRERVEHPLLRSHVALVKYPALIWVLGEATTQALSHRFLVALLIYLCFAVWELLHDARLATAAGAQVTLAVEMVTLSVAPAALGIALGSNPGVLTLRIAMALAAAATLGALLHRAIRRPGGCTRPAPVFATGLVQILLITLGDTP
jgi:hypothetical protein